MLSLWLSWGGSDLDMRLSTRLVRGDGEKRRWKKQVELEEERSVRLHLQVNVLMEVNALANVV